MDGQGRRNCIKIGCGPWAAKQEEHFALWHKLIRRVLCEDWQIKVADHRPIFDPLIGKLTDQKWIWQAQIDDATRDGPAWMVSPFFDCHAAEIDERRLVFID